MSNFSFRLNGAFHNITVTFVNVLRYGRRFIIVGKGYVWENNPPKYRAVTVNELQGQYKLLADYIISLRLDLFLKRKICVYEAYILY